MNATVEKEWTINQIQEAVRATGSHWFDPDTMRFFGTRVLGSTVYKGEGGIFFVTSEWDGFSGKENGKRAYTVRKFNPVDADIETVGSICQYKDADEAIEAIERLIIKGTVIREQHRPISEAEQFLCDLRKHGKPTADSDDAESLCILGKQHHKMMEDYCNGIDIYRADGEPKAKLRNLRDHIMLIARNVGADSVIFSGDPRGCTVKLVWNDGETNDFGKEGLVRPRAQERRRLPEH
jgi:hypothetical protein